MILKYRAKATEPEVKQTVKDAIGTEGKPKEILDALLGTVAEELGYEGPFALKFISTNLEGQSQLAHLCRNITLFTELLIDEQRLSPADFAKKLHEMRMEQMREQMGAQPPPAQPTPSGPPLTPEEKAKIIEAAREAQRMMASLTPQQRSMLTSAAQNQMASVSQENPSMTPQERSRIVSDKMSQLHRMIKEGGMESPQLLEALRKLNVMVDSVSQSEGAGAAGAPSRAPAPPSEEDDIGATTTMDRS